MSRRVSAKKENEKAELFSLSSQKSEKIQPISKRLTEELVIALIGPVGSGVSTSTAEIQNVLENKFQYNVRIIKPSADVIEKSAHLIDESVDFSEKTGAERTKELQRIGSLLREKFGEDFIAQKCVEEISINRNTEIDKSPKSRRYAHIIDSLKHPSEHNLLSAVYGDSFWSFAIFAPVEVRQERLKREGYTDEEIQKIFQTDQDAGTESGQKVRDTVHLADFFLRNDKTNKEKLAKSVDRYFNILFNIEVITPTRDEAAMYTAVSSSASSACLSRQVGAAIYSQSNELIGLGSNDVPKFGGGLYNEEDGENDNRCRKWRGQICHNDHHKKRLYNDIAIKIAEDRPLKEKINKQVISESVKKTDVKQLIEFSRAVHAEMEAIISVARAGVQGIVGATLYCTTFPCHSCARHIVASGIARVVYVEPYPKSLALDLHDDSISLDEKDEGKRVIFLQYEGVAPKNIVKLFTQKTERKIDGRMVKFVPADAVPQVRSPLEGFAVREQIVVDSLRRAEGGVGQSNDEDG